MQEPENSVPLQSPDQVGAKLSEARNAAAQGDRNRAHELAIHATDMAPRNVEALLFRAATTDDLKETLDCLSRVLALRPDHSGAQRSMYETLQHVLEQNAFLAYMDETAQVYRVRTGSGDSAVVPKARAIIPPYPARKPLPLERASRWFTWSLLGLPWAGLVTLLTAPLAMGYAWSAQARAHARSDRVRARAILLGSLLLWLFSLVLVTLFVIHLVY